MDQGPRTYEAKVADSARRKVARRVLPLVFLLYVVAYLDRANAGFAKLRMMDDLHFLDDVFGWGFGLFFAGYLFLEVPGALLVEHWSARKWFARIMVTWGACSMATALIRTPGQFYLARFLLGLAEAGFFPGVIVYFTHWFPRRDRARALAVMLFGVPVSLSLGARVSGLLLEQDWLGVAGWQWVFLAEGAPAVVLGLALPFVLTDRPRQARWLTPAERDWLERTLADDRAEAAAAGGGLTLRQALRQRTVWLLALGILATNTGGYALVFWLPTAVQGLLRAAGREASPSAVLDWTGLVYLCGLAGVWVSGRSSDRTGDRKWHCVAGQALAGVFLALSAVPGQPWPAVFAWLCLTGFFSFFWISPFWVLPTLTLSSSGAAVSVGLINMCANVAGLLGSPAVGGMRTAGLGDAGCLALLAACYVLGGAIMAFVPVPRGRAG
jgi:ACS family tartrate transporter-like MFS transporter